MSKLASKQSPKKNKKASLKSSKTKKKYPGFIQMFIHMEWYGKALFIGVGLWVLYMSTVQIWLNQRVALNYLQKKYNKEFTVRSDKTAPSWIGKPPTYHGLAKVKDGSDDVEFVVVCELNDLMCTDFYKEELEELKIKNELLTYIENDLMPGIMVDVGLIENDVLGNKKINVRFHDKSKIFNYKKIEKIMDSLESYKEDYKDLTISVHYAFYENEKKSMYCNLKPNEKITRDCFKRAIQ